MDAFLMNSLLEVFLIYWVFWNTGKFINFLSELLQSGLYILLFLQL
jgi:hypothetical protein